MTAAIRIEVKATKAYSHIPSIIGKIKADTARMAYNFVRRAASLMRTLAPVRSGYLKASIVTLKIAMGWRLEVGASYGAYVNYGTRHHPPQPFFDQAIMLAKAEM